MEAVTIGVIDDELSVRRALGRLLRICGYQVVTFASVDDFLLQSESDWPRCLIVDLRLPGKTGLDLLESLRATGHPLPLVLITGHGDIPMAVRAMKAGAIDFLTKPFDERVLLDAIDQALRPANRL